MNSVVIYGSHFGNTKKVAEAIAAGLKPSGSVQMFSADDAPAVLPERTDLLVIGGPTEGFRMTAPVARVLDRMDSRSVGGLRAAVFDTRMRPRWWLLGYAGPGIARRISRLGARLIAPPEGFLVEGTINQSRGEYPVLVAGELERAARWAASLAAIVDEKIPTHA